MDELRTKRIKLGLAPTRRNLFSVEDSLRQKALIEAKLREWGVDFVNLDSVNAQGLLYDTADARKVVALFKEQAVDAVFCPHVNFGTENAVAYVGREIGKPFLLWGPRDEAPDEKGERLRDTQCGLFATSKVLRRFGVPFSYIVNSRVSDEVFERGFKTFLGAAAAANSFLGARIGQISTRPDGFYTVIVNEGELLERWGIELIGTTLVDLTEAMKKRVAKPTDELEQTVADFQSRAEFPNTSDDQIRMMAAMKLELLAWAEREALDAIAIQCWNGLQAACGVMPCFVDSELTGLGLPVACETDVHGALTSLLSLNAAQTTPTFFTDLTVRHPENENGELLWHCGPFPMKLAVEGGPRKVSGHYLLPTECPGTAEWQIRGGDLTLARFDGDHGEYSLFIGEARGCEGPYTRGTYVWIEVGNWPLWEETLIYGPYIHHCVGVHAKIAPALAEACRFLPGLRADPVEPTEAEIRAWLRGGR